MTGEITLRGRVLPIGGLKEKSLAAHRAGIRKVLLPKDNEKDLEEIPESVRDEMEFVTVSHMDEVLDHALVTDQMHKCTGARVGFEMKITQAEFVISAVSLTNCRGCLAGDCSGRALQCRQVFADQPDDQPQESGPNQFCAGQDADI